MNDEFYNEVILPTHYSHWDPNLQQCSFATVVVELTDNEAALLQTYYEAQMGPGADDKLEELEIHLPDLKEKISKAVAHFGASGCCVKTDIRGPKDSFYGYKHGFQCIDANKVLSLLTDSERIWEDIQTLQAIDEPVRLLFRCWYDIRPQDEWRCFQRHGKLTAVSQNDYFNHYPELLDERTQRGIIDIVKSAHEVLRSSMPDSVVFDLWIPNSPRLIIKYSKETEALKKAVQESQGVNPIILPSEARCEFAHGRLWTLIEINPWNSSPFGTDPCLADWNKLEDEQITEEVLRPLIVGEPIQKPDLESLLEESPND